MCAQKYKITVFFALVTVLTVAFAAVEEKPKAPVVFVEQARKSDLFDQLTYPARLAPRVNATVLAESEGIVSKIVAPLGRQVARNQRIMTIKHTDPVYQYAPFTVAAPVAGIISQIEVTEGSLVTKGQKLAAITDPTQIRVLVEIASPDLPDIRAGLEGKLKVVSVENEIPVKVAGISPTVDSATGTATAELVFNKSEPPLPPGVVGRVSFRVRNHTGIQIPEQAVVYKGRDTFLRLIHDGKSKLTPVTLGPSRRGFIEVVKGLSDGDQVIVRASAYVADGESVTVQQGGSGALE
ncbi:MAG: efflux RND transporter periplasmic adaptor subunit [Deltaproteobacteria bacterium]|nr:efflux RND transporter periplasmic adaptor subunit [Deltaproteobacteria bacterium]